MNLPPSARAKPAPLFARSADTDLQVLFGARWAGGRDPRDIAEDRGHRRMLYVARQDGGIYRGRDGRVVILETDGGFWLRVDGIDRGVHLNLTRAREAAFDLTRLAGEVAA